MHKCIQQAETVGLGDIVHSKFWGDPPSPSLEIDAMVVSKFQSPIIIIIIIIMKEFIVRLLQCGHEHRCITLSIKLKSVVK